MVSGGDEARVARARGSGRGALPSSILANGTPSSNVPPPRAGWAVRITEATLTPTSKQRPSDPGTTPTAVERWASERAPVWTGRAATASSSPSLSAASREARGPASFAGLERRWKEREELEATKKVELRQQQCHQDHRLQRRTETTQQPSLAAAAAGRLESRSRPMSRNDAISPLTRRPSSRTNIAAIAGDFAGNGEHRLGDDDCGGVGEDTDARLVEDRVHDHSRPFPPPRLPLVHVATVPSVPPPPPPPPPTSSSSQPSVTTTSVPGTPTSRAVPLTVPLTPLSSSFRSWPSLRRTQQNVVEASSSDANSRSLLSSSPAESTTMAASSPRSPIGEVSLAAPRPDGERTINEYVEAPFKQHTCCNQERRLDVDGKGAGDCPKIERRHHHHHNHHRHHRGHEGAADATPVPTHRARGRARNHQVLRFGGGGNDATSVATSTNAAPATANAVTKQPVSFTKEPASTLGARNYDPSGLSIICDFCDKCRCESCREPPPLPSRWLCDNTCLCSAKTVLDYASCLCCVKGLFYHCVDGGGGVASGVDAEASASCSDEPCSCAGHRRLSRWACLGALTLVMPCLLCYWPLRGCVAVCEMCYARHAAQGCRCNPSAIGGASGRHHPITSDIGDSRDPEKRLLDPVTPEL